MNSQRLFDQLVDLTAIRDIELLEISLLRTIQQYLRPLDLRIIRIGSDNKLRSEVVYGSERCNVYLDNISLSDEVKGMLEHIQTSNTDEFTLTNGSGCLTLYKINKTHSTTLYLQVLNHDRISRENRHLLLGLMEIFRNFCELLSEGITDSLTGLLNRKSFDRAIDKIYDLIPLDESRSEADRRNKQSIKYWLVMLDIDHFKKINDKFGHLYGDDVLILVSQIIRNCFRDDDLIFRFGGEEFVLMIRCSDEEGARKALERLLTSVSSYLFPQVGTVTISGGAVCIDRETFSATLLDYADQALYYSKQNGRNRVTFFEDLVSKGLAKIEEVKHGSVQLF